MESVLCERRILIEIHRELKNEQAEIKSKAMALCWMEARGLNAEYNVKAICVVGARVDEHMAECDKSAIRPDQVKAECGASTSCINELKVAAVNGEGSWQL